MVGDKYKLEVHFAAPTAICIAWFASVVYAISRVMEAVPWRTLQQSIDRRDLELGTIFYASPKSTPIYTRKAATATKTLYKAFVA